MIRFIAALSAGRYEKDGKIVTSTSPNWAVASEEETARKLLLAHAFKLWPTAEGWINQEVFILPAPDEWQEKN